MRLSIEKRQRVIEIYEKNNLHFEKNKFEKLRLLAQNENIIATKLRFRRLITKWLNTGKKIKSCYCFKIFNLLKLKGMLRNKDGKPRKCKVTENQLRQLDRMVFNQRDLVAPKLKENIGISASTRTVQKYLNLLGWKKRRTGFCQIVQFKTK